MEKVTQKHSAEVEAYVLHVTEEPKGGDVILFSPDWIFKYRSPFLGQFGSDITMF